MFVLARAATYSTRTSSAMPLNRPSEALVGWMSGQADEDLFISCLTVAEIRRGILEPAGKKRRQLERWFSGPDGRNRCSQAGYSRSTKRRAWSGHG